MLFWEIRTRVHDRFTTCVESFSSPGITTRKKGLPVCSVFNPEKNTGNVRQTNLPKHCQWHSKQDLPMVNTTIHQPSYCASYWILLMYWRSCIKMVCFVGQCTPWAFVLGVRRPNGHASTKRYNMWNCNVQDKLYSLRLYYVYLFKQRI